MHQDKGEQTYNIFYQLCEGADPVLKGWISSSNDWQFHENQIFTIVCIFVWVHRQVESNGYKGVQLFESNGIRSHEWKQLS